MELGAAGYAAAAGATAASVAGGLFSYNRANYGFDQKNGWARFNAGIGMACAQTAQYKADIQALTALTQTRQHTFHDVAAMALTILTALYCPGRLGLHTPPPPEWLMGLFMLNVAGTYMFLGLTLWLAQHAFARSGVSSIHMLSRYVRFPIPSMTMLDRARRFLSSFEEQSAGEAFRVPFRPHQHKFQRNKGGFNEYEGTADPMSVEAAAKARTRHGYDVPAWYRKEKEIKDNIEHESLLRGASLPLAAKGEADCPEHFEIYREMQNDWWPYDVYSRISLFLAFQHLLHNWVYHQLGHHFQETRALFAAACVTLTVTVLQWIVLQLDIVPNSWEAWAVKIGPLAPWCALFATAIDYSRWYSAPLQAFGFFLVFMAYFIHIFYTIMLIRLCAPSDEAPAAANTPGASWWPEEWKLPSAFQHALWLVAPPKGMAPGEVDVVEQLRNPHGKKDDGKKEDASAGTAAKRKDVHKALGRQTESAAWWNVKVGLFAMLIGWIFLTFGFLITVINQGTMHPSLISAPGLPNNARDPRYRPTKIGGHEPTEVGTGGVHGPARGVRQSATGAVHRRLSDDLLDANATRDELVQKVRDLLPYLNKIAHGSIPADTVEASVLSMVPEELAAAISEKAAPVRAQVSFPPLFEPRVMAAGPDSMAAVLSHHGRGAIVGMPEGRAERVFAQSTPFALEGAAEHGPLAAAHWDEAGLLLAAASGAVLHCPGSPSGRWHCAPHVGAKLPIQGGRVAITRDGLKALRAAVAYPGESSVTFFSHSGHDSAPWLPAGEARTHCPAAALSFAKGVLSHLLVSSADGAVAKLAMDTGATTAEVKPVSGLEAGHTWPAACHLSDGTIARLAVKGGDAPEPMLFLG